MSSRILFHIIGGDSRSRASELRKILSLGHQCEIYGDVLELLYQRPSSGVVLASGIALKSGVGALREKLLDQEVSLPLVVAAEHPSTKQIVDAIHDGAMDFVKLPLDAGEVARVSQRFLSDGTRYQQVSRRIIAARKEIAALTGRERGVLNLLSAGYSNREMGVELGISSRTVEIHRKNMMSKLGARKAIEAVQVRSEAGYAAADAEKIRSGTDF